MAVGLLRPLTNTSSMKPDGTVAAETTVSIESAGRGAPASTHATATTERTTNAHETEWLVRMATSYGGLGDSREGDAASRERKASPYG